MTLFSWYKQNKMVQEDSLVDSNSADITNSSVQMWPTAKVKSPHAFVIKPQSTREKGDALLNVKAFKL